jgi:hypothetical protein
MKANDAVVSITTAHTEMPGIKLMGQEAYWPSVRISSVGNVDRIVDCI